MLKDCVFALNLLSEFVFKFKKLVIGTEFQNSFKSIGAIISALFEKWVALKKAVLNHTFSSRSLHKSTLDENLKCGGIYRAGLSNLFIGMGCIYRRKVIVGHMHFYLD